MLQTIYLCDDCAKRLVAEAFNDRPPVYHGETIQGFCGLCNLDASVTMRQWFVCGVCWNVVLSYQKSLAASAGVHAWWANEIAPLLPHLGLHETEPVRLTPYARKPKTKFEGAAGLELLDFRVVDQSEDPGIELFNIEQKSGPGSIKEMSEFQLDVNDYNDIVGATKNTTLPSYIVHVQACSEYSFPTRRTVVRAMWWTDIFRLREHQKRVKIRRGEDKQAIYYRPSAFEEIETFQHELTSRGYIRLRERLMQEDLTPIG